jgi:excisionase family DNA binding protein
MVHNHPRFTIPGTWVRREADADVATVRTQSDSENLLTPSEVATLFRVDPKTVTRWAKAGKLASIRTLGGHRRYRESEVRLLLEGNTTETLEA